MFLVDVLWQTVLNPPTLTRITSLCDQSFTVAGPRISLCNNPPLHLRYSLQVPLESPVLPRTVAPSKYCFHSPYKSTLLHYLMTTIIIIIMTAYMSSSSSSAPLKLLENHSTNVIIIITVNYN